MSTTGTSSFQRWFRTRDLAQAHPEAKRLRLARLVRAADVRAHGALDDSNDAAVIRATLGLRDAIAILAVAASEADDAPTDDARAYLEQLFARGVPEGVTPKVVLDVLENTELTYVDDLEPEQRAELRSQLLTTATWLRQRFDLRSTTYLRGRRVGQIAAAALALLLVGYEVVSFATRLPNLALGKRVTASSFASAGGMGAVDGVKDGAVGVQTRNEAKPWVEIDLGAEMNVRRVVVYNRGDRNLNDGMPYELDVAAEDHNLTFVARREKPFGDGSLGAPPWSQKVDRRVRYVRLSARNYIALSEIEVQGKP